MDFTKENSTFEEWETEVNSLLSNVSSGIEVKYLTGGKIGYELGLSARQEYHECLLVMAAGAD